uniref:endo-polygalacturonase n=1 Tax=Phaedon cochleariae TaxID=80249 RepID=K7DW96_PHACE|nr:glycoside hydrolase family 28 protein [Phaedon cochleariae]
MFSHLKSLVSLLVIVVGITASSTSESLEYLTAKNLTSDYCYARSYAEVADVVKRCTHICIENFEVPAGVTLQLNLQKHSVLLIEGTISFGVAHWDGPLMYITGEFIQVIGGTNHLIHGRGEQYWDGNGGAAGVTKPERVMSINAKRGSFKNINIKNCPMFCVSIIGTDLTFSGFNIDNKDGFKGGLAKNTDAMGFVYSDNILIENSNIVNQDDCINIMASSNAVIRNVHCWGSHGLSFSSGLSNTDENNDIHNVTFKDCSIGGSLNGIHILTMPSGGRGKISQITYRNINIIDVTQRAIEFRQDYLRNGQPGNNIRIDDLTLDNIYGTVTGRSAVGVYINCGDGSCSNWNWRDVRITGAKNKDTCNFHPNGYSC